MGLFKARIDLRWYFRAEGDFERDFPETCFNMLLIASRSYQYFCCKSAFSFGFVVHELYIIFALSSMVTRDFNNLQNADFQNL